MLAELDVGQLADVVWVSLLAGIGVTVAYSLVVLGTSRSNAARRAGRGGAAVAYATLAGLCVAAVAAGMVLAVEIMLSKS